MASNSFILFLNWLILINLIKKSQEKEFYWIIKSDGYFIPDVYWTSHACSHATTHVCVRTVQVARHSLRYFFSSLGIFRQTSEENPSICVTCSKFVFFRFTSNALKRDSPVCGPRGPRKSRRTITSTHCLNVCSYCLICFLGNSWNSVYTFCTLYRGFTSSPSSSALLIACLLFRTQLSS